ncbi:MAG: hypothetical protein QOF36_2573 [Microbacteriaceae bacterium]|jgi:hypothetical protein|nr:hypothetical protein [Microbacteriaceae bacterium]
MLPDASPSGLLADEGFRERLREQAVDPDKAVRYKGRIRQVLEAKAADARRQGMTVDFVQAYQHGKLIRLILVLDPSMPEHLQRQAVVAPGTLTWDQALTNAGLLSGGRQRATPPTAYVECPQCREFGVDTWCPMCKGRGLVPSSDDS